MPTSACTSELLNEIYERFARTFSRDGVNLQHYGGLWLAFKPQDVLRPNAPILLEDTPTDPQFTYNDFCRLTRRAAQGGIRVADRDGNWELLARRSSAGHPTAAPRLSTASPSRAMDALPDRPARRR